MEDYLSGYLEVLPEYQRKRIEEIVQDNQDLFSTKSTTEEQFVEIIRRLAQDHEPLTRYLPQVGRLNATTYNDFHSNLHIDLNFLFLESLLIENATANYERIFDGIIADLDKEVKKLRQRVESLKLVNEGEEGLVVEKRSFESSAEMESFESNPNLFKDRDGTLIKNPVVFERSHDLSYIVLSKTKEINCIRDEQGMPTATLEIKDRRGNPGTVSAEKYGLKNAIDANPETYWAEVILTDEAIHMEMTKTRGGQ